MCGDDEKNQGKLGKLGAGYKKEDTTSAVKKVNFYTSTAFEGQDIFDEAARSYIVADGAKNHTKIDILTTLPQIIGRVRDAKVQNQVTLLYSSSAYPMVSEQEYEKAVRKQEMEAEAVVKDFGIVSDATKERLRKDAQTDEYLLLTPEGDLRLNTTAVQSKLNSFTTTHTTYYVAKDSESKNYDHTINSVPYHFTANPLGKLGGYEKLRLGMKADFQTLCESYIKEQYSYLFHSTAGEETKEELAARMDSLKGYPQTIQNAFKELGTDKMKALKFREKAFKDELAVADKKSSNGYKVVKMLGYRERSWLSRAQSKIGLQKIHDKLGIGGTVTGTTLSEYFILKPLDKKIDGNKVKGFVVVTAKFNPTAL